MQSKNYYQFPKEINALNENKIVQEVKVLLLSSY